MPTPYRPDHFARLAATPLGQALWHWLHEPAHVQVMEVASYLRRPAVEALSPYLVADFGPNIGQNTTKQMIGHMIRQVLEHRGYHLDRNNVRIKRPGNVFFSGSAYRLPDPAFI